MPANAEPSYSSGPRSISGTVPGQLDPTQPERLLHVPGSTLSFASFHPLAASSSQNTTSMRQSSINKDLYRPKRVVIETTPGPRGESFWRFVPRARREESVENEGAWPRAVEICGEMIYCSQDQWDVYKLDPEYDCFVRAPPNFTVISKKKGKDRGGLHDLPSAAAATMHRSPPPHSKRRFPSSSSDERLSPEFRKRFRTFVSISDDSSEDGNEGPQYISDSDDEIDEVEEIIVDGFTRARRTGSISPGSSRLPKTARCIGPRSRLQHRRKVAEEKRRLRREKIATRTKMASELSEKDQEMIDLTMEDDEPTVSKANLNGRSGNFPCPTTTKRKISPTDELSARNGSSRPDDVDRRAPETTEQQKSKRPRLFSPTSARRELKERRAERERRMREQYKERANLWNETQHQTFLNDILADVPEDLAEKIRRNGINSRAEVRSGANASEIDEEAMRRAAIEESQRKLAELEKDKPLWEEAARKRMERERAAEEARRAKKEEEQRRATQAEDRRRRRETEQAEAELRARAARERAEREKEQERRRRQQQHERWTSGPWTTQRALERYKLLCETFDTSKFTPSDPVTFEIVPWPVLHTPATLTVEDVDWTAVEAFFNAVKPHLRAQDYKTFVEKSHKRFHPDRWRARGLLKSVEDIELRDCLEVAANTVAQALTPLWREVKGG
ncbi:hypothetical protein AcV5_007057 [Taiwanofungus camphoratus]|nr:hypothetical protein AcV5_007057 [Antrodia cinnamomea]